MFDGDGACVLGLLMFRAVALGLLAPPHEDQGIRQPLAVLQPEPSRTTGATIKLQTNARRQGAVTIRGILSTDWWFSFGLYRHPIFPIANRIRKIRADSPGGNVPGRDFGRMVGRVSPAVNGNWERKVLSCPTNRNTGHKRDLRTLVPASRNFAR